MPIFAKILMQIGTFILAFLGLYSYVTWRSELILDKKIKYLPDREIILGRMVSILIFILAGLLVWALEILIK